MDLYESLQKKESRVSVIGLGYVGLPIAVSLSRYYQVIGFDISEEKVNHYKEGIDLTKEVGNEGLANAPIDYTTNPKELLNALFHIVAVPTPVNEDHTPNLTPLIKASETLGRNLKKGSIVVYEATVYPSVTEDICVPILERESGLKYGKDFKVGYSPERINPGDKVHRLETITKVVSGMDEQSLDVISKVYESIIDVGVHRAESIQVAEAAKVIENAQRDINIAFMNELSIIFNKLGIDTKAVLEAAGTKWNFLPFTPGLVGGHCIGVDPYYLTYKAEQVGYHSQIILSGRRINDDMGRYVTENVVKMMLQEKKDMRDARIGILGFTFKENCPDTRNTRIIDIIKELDDYGIKSLVHDPVADTEEAKREYNLTFDEYSDFKDLDALIIAVGHQEFKTLGIEDIKQMFKEGHAPIVADIKGVWDKNKVLENGMKYWRL